MRRCGRGSEGTCNSHKRKIWTWRRSPDEYAFVRTCLALHQILQDAHGQNTINEFLDAHPPKDKKLAAAVRCCRVQEAWGQTHVKFYFRLSLAYITFETNIMTAFEQSGGDRLYGQAPRGSLERKALDLLQNLGFRSTNRSVHDCAAPAQWVAGTARSLRGVRGI